MYRRQISAALISSIVSPYENSAVAESAGQALRTMRAHLNMDVGFISEFIGGSSLLRHVDNKSGRAPLKVGDRLPLADGYCEKIVSGKLPQLIRNTAELPEARAIPATHQIPIGSYLSVPLRFSDGRLYGTFCCFGFKPKMDLSERDHLIVSSVAKLVVRQIEAQMSAIHERAEIFERIELALKSDQPAIVYQPSYRLSDHRLLGAESLSRFGLQPARTPDVWFADAERVNLRTELELKAIRNAIDGFAPAWRAGPYYLAVNSSPQTVLDSRLGEWLADCPADRLMLEITEHDHVENYDALMRALSPLRARGVRIAVDDAGSGYASMRHILNIRPDVIKLDVSLTNGIESDRVRLALARALCEFGLQTECTVTAEGIETSAQLEALSGIGVHAGQGYFLGRPMPFADFDKLIPLQALAG